MASDKEIAKQIIDRQDGYWNGTFGINESALSVEMANYVIRTPGVVYWVLVLLEEQKYDSATIIRVTRGFLDQTVQSVFSSISKTYKGKVLIRKLRSIIKCDLGNNKTASRCMKLETTLSQSVKAGKQATKEQTNGNSAQPRKLSDVEMDWYVNYNNSSVFNGTRLRRNKFKSDVCWDLPLKGLGFVSYNVDDLKGKRNDKYGYDQIGTKETVEAMIRIAREWNQLHPNNTLEYGDISRPGGIDTPDHGTHNTGKAFDMRLLRKGKSDGTGFTYHQESIYSQSLTKEFILLVVKLYPGTEFYFNDPVLDKVDKDTKGLVSRSGGHDNHLHVMFPGGKE